MRRMIGSSVALRVSGIITVVTLPPRFRMPKTGVLPAAPRPRLPLMGAETALVDLDRPVDRRALVELVGDHLAQAMVEERRRLPIHSDQIGDRPRGHPADQERRQPPLPLLR